MLYTWVFPLSSLLSEFIHWVFNISSIYDDVHRVVSDFQALENEVSDLKWKVGDVERMLSDKIDEIRKREQ